MNRVEFLNRLIEFHQYRSYLEIGVSRGECFTAIAAPFKVGVDPDPAILQLRPPGGLLWCTTSDIFFAAVNAASFFDLVFVDGLHHHEQVYRDVVHALDHLSPHGTIVMHDCNPGTEPMQRVPRVQGEWTGDCWKAVVRLRTTRPDLNVSVLDADYGLGVVRRGPCEPTKVAWRWQELSWNDLAAHRDDLLGLIPLEQIGRYFQAR